LEAADYHTQAFFVLDQQLQDFVAYLSRVTTSTGTLRHKTIQCHLDGLARLAELQLGIDVLKLHPMYKWVLDGCKHADEAKGIFVKQEAPLMTMMLVWGDAALENSPCVRASLWVSIEFELRISECVPTRANHYPTRGGTKFLRDKKGCVMGMSLLIPSSKEDPNPVTRRIVLTNAQIATCATCSHFFEQSITIPAYVC
jgi:hypothetical protein